MKQAPRGNIIIPNRIAYYWFYLSAHMQFAAHVISVRQPWAEPATDPERVSIELR